MKLAILILNWNGKTLLQQFLPSVVEFTANHDIYVIDNASTDHSVDFLEVNFPDVNCIKLDQNYGYAEGYNRAIEQVNADIYCLLNSDVRVTNNWTSPILDLFKRQSNISIIQPKILDQNQQSKFEYAGAAGGFVDQLGYPYCKGRIFQTIEHDSGQYDTENPIFWASGACLFIRSSVFKDLNGFDELFFAHMEEIDLCWRAYNKGHEVWFTPKSTVYHVGGASLKISNPKKTFYNFRNSLFTLTKNTPHQLFPLIVIRLILDGIAGIRFFLLGKPKHTMAIIKAHFSFYKNFRNLCEFRSQNPKRLAYKGAFSIVLQYYLSQTKTFSALKQH